MLATSVAKPAAGEKVDASIARRYARNLERRLATTALAHALLVTRC
jgi:hypothetical protein